VAKDLTISGSGNATITYNPNLVARTRIISQVEYSGADCFAAGAIGFTPCETYRFAVC
jgi:hypothetical protein